MFLVARLGVLLLTGAATLAVAARWPRLRTAALIGSVAGGLMALGVLGLAFLTEDWRFATVVGHARPDVAWTLRVAAIWAGPEGSLLLWTTMAATAALAVTRLGSSALPGRLLAATTAAYGLVVLTEADPFERMEAPPGAGNGLQPVLEHPAMLWHPPVLYLGLIAILIPTALSVGNPGRRETGAIAWTLPLALALLTSGLATGANWAHVELGWGGYWAWDPIENAGLVAWLAGASLLHRLGGGMDAEPEASWSLPATAVAVVPGIAAIWATTITRTGVLNSVHAFAERPTLRVMLLSIAVVFTATMFLLASVRRSKDGEPRPAPPIRSVAGFVAIGLAAIVVAVGTYEPALERLVGNEPFIITGRFYSLLLWPIAVVAAVLRIRAVIRSSTPRGSTQGLAGSVGGAVLAMLVVTAAAGAPGLVLAAAGGAIAGSTIFDRRPDPSAGRSRLAHVGVGVLMVGIAGTTATVAETVVVLTDVEAATALGVVNHRGIDIVDGGGTSEAIASVDITMGGRTRTFHPRLVSYRSTGGESTEVDTDRGWAADVQVALIDADADRATYRLVRLPRISLVWIGAALITIGFGNTARVRRRQSRLQPDGEPAVT